MAHSRNVIREMNWTSHATGVIISHSLIPVLLCFTTLITFDVGYRRVRPLTTQQSVVMTLRPRLRHITWRYGSKYRQWTFNQKRLDQSVSLTGLFVFAVSCTRKAAGNKTPLFAYSKHLWRFIVQGVMVKVLCLLMSKSSDLRRRKISPVAKPSTAPNRHTLTIWDVVAIFADICFAITSVVTHETSARHCACFLSWHIA